MSRIPSLDAIGAALSRIGRRFPLVVVVVALVAVAAQVLIDDTADWAIRLVVAGSFAVPALVATALLREMRPGRQALWTVDAAVVLVAVLFAWAWTGWTDELGFRRLAQANLGGLLAVAVLPFVGGGRAVFWPFNRTMFVRFVVASIFAGVLFAGLGLAIAALEVLFGLDVDNEIYPRLFFALLTVFHPLYVLGGVPDPLRALESDRDFPRPLRVFAQFILLPLVSLYLAILLAYLGRVIFTQEWPQGWIGWLVSAVAIAGLLAILLLDPVTREREGGWVPTAARVYFAAMIPALVMLLMALGKRVAQYGITENRYFLGALAFWMIALCVTRVLRRWKDPRWIPATLLVVVVGTSVGPWGAYAVAKQSQSARLEVLLDEVGRLRDGVAVSDTTSYALEDAAEVRATIRYLVTTHGRDAIDPWFAAYADELDEGLDLDVRRSSYAGSQIADRAAKAIGLDNARAVVGLPEGEYQVMYTRELTARADALGGATHALEVQLVGPEATAEVELSDDEILTLRVDGLEIAGFWHDADADTLFRVDLRPLLDHAKLVRSGETYVGDPVSLPLEAAEWTGTYVIRHFQARIDEDLEELQRVNGLLALGRR